MSQVHIIGAGLAGLAAAVDLAKAGRQVRLYEAAPQAGGRCRSYHDVYLGQRIDNGNHLVLSGNTSVARFCADIGADGWHMMPSASFPFVDIATSQRWSIDINAGPVPYWVLNATRRAPDTRWSDYLPALKILLSNDDALLSDIVRRDNAAYASFWEPLILAVLNAPLHKAAASLLGPVFKETILKGGAYCKPMIAKACLADALIDPALRALTSMGAHLHFGARLSAIEANNNVVTHLAIGGEQVEVAPGDQVVLAIPSWQAKALLPWLEAPGAGEGILNIHYAFETGASDPAFLGMVGSLAQWVFVRADMASVTVSAAGQVFSEQPDTLAQRCWAEIAIAYGWKHGTVPKYRVIKEKRATFDQSPQGIQKRPDPRTMLKNLTLAGDWTNTRLPATIEGAVRSGQRAAALISA